jgi:spore cortex biosynthesis protein YabQ
MNPGITFELHLFFISILWGALVLIAYDLLRILRRIIRHNVAVVAIQDLIFWVVAGVFIFAMIYVKNNGIIRGFFVMGMVIGMLAYHYLLSDLIVMLISSLILLILRPFSLALALLKRGLIRLKSKLMALYNKIFGRLKRSVKSVKISMKNRREKRRTRG